MATDSAHYKHFSGSRDQMRPATTADFHAKRGPSPLLTSLEIGTGYEVAASHCKYARLVVAPVSKGRIRLGLVMGPERRETSAVFEPVALLKGIAGGILKELKNRVTRGAK